MVDLSSTGIRTVTEPWHEMMEQDSQARPERRRRETEVVRKEFGVWRHRLRSDRMNTAGKRR